LITGDLRFEVLLSIPPDWHRSARFQLHADSDSKRPFRFVLELKRFKVVTRRDP
jgi:hypothetical protein